MVNGDLQVRDDLDKNLVARAINILIFFVLFSFERQRKKQNKSHRMQNTCTSRSTDFQKLKTVTSKTPLTLYGRGFCASDHTPTTTGSPAGPQSNQNVWVLPPISCNDGEKCQSFRGKLAYFTIERVSTKKKKRKKSGAGQHTAFFT